MEWLNLIVWVLMLVITITWTIAVVFKPNFMGGRESWGPVNFKMSILWWISILSVFFVEASPFYFFIMVPISFIIVSITSMKKEVEHVVKNKLPPESIMTRAQPNTEALFSSLLYYFIFLVVVYFVNNFFFG